jgi:hypothetical protein
MLMKAPSMRAVHYRPMDKERLELLGLRGNVEKDNALP